MANNIALLALSITLGLMFVLIGVIKLTPVVSDDMHKEMKSVFKRARSVFPLFELTGWRPKPSQYRRACGTIEVICGLLLAFIPGRLKIIANVLLLLNMLLSLYTHWALGDEMKHYTGALIFGLLLACRLVIHMQNTDQSEDVKKDD